MWNFRLPPLHICIPMCITPSYPIFFTLNMCFFKPSFVSGPNFVNGLLFFFPVDGRGGLTPFVAFNPRLTLLGDRILTGPCTQFAFFFRFLRFFVRVNLLIPSLCLRSPAPQRSWHLLHRTPVTLATTISTIVSKNPYLLMFYIGTSGCKSNSVLFMLSCCAHGTRHDVSVASFHLMMALLLLW